MADRETLVERLEAVLEDAAKSAFVKAQSVYRSDHDHFPLKYTWETTAEGVREGWRNIAYAAVEAAIVPPLGTQPEPRTPRFFISSEEAASELTRLNAKVEELERERLKLRTALIGTGRNLGAFLADDVSSDFLTLLPEEARLLKARLARAVEVMRRVKARALALEIESEQENRHG